MAITPLRENRAESSLGRAVERPPPFVKERNATYFGALTALAAGRYFTATARRRLAILLSDGESRRFQVAAVARALGKAGIDLLVVRLWSPTDAIYIRGRRDRGYAPDPSTTPRPEELAAATAGGHFYRTEEPAAIVREARTLLGTAPVVTSASNRRTVALAPYVVLATILPLGFLLVRR
jgi:hypothetical protein